MQFNWIPLTFKVTTKDPDIMRAKCRMPTKCIVVNMAMREWQEKFGIRPRVRVEANCISIHDGSYNHHFQPPKKLLVDVVLKFDEIGDRLGEDAARKAMPRGKRYALKYIDSIKKGERSPAARAKDNEQRKERRKRYRATHGRADPQQRLVGIAM